jgi:hypothetical protein
MTEEQLNTLREQDKNLRDAIRMEEAEMPQMPADLNARLMQRMSQEPKKARTRRLWPWVAAACVVGFAMLWFTPPEEKKADAALHAHLVRAYHTKHQLEVSNQMDARESFEDIERRLRIEGAQLKEEFKMSNQIY